MTRAVDAATDALAVSRLVRLAQQDEIPVGNLRERLIDRYGDQTWTGLLVCPYCLSVWVGAGVVLARYLFPRAWPWIARVLALSEATGHLHHLADR